MADPITLGMAFFKFIGPVGAAILGGIFILGGAGPGIAKLLFALLAIGGAIWFISTMGSTVAVIIVLFLILVWIMFGARKSTPWGGF